MKTKTSFYHRTFAFAYVLLVAVIFCGCEQEITNKAEKRYTENKANEIFIGVNYQIVEIDSCEYLIGRDNGSYNGGYFLSHKGNCKFCAERSKK
jgi:hypothetical protein